MRQWWIILAFAVAIVVLTELAQSTGEKSCATVYALGYGGDQAIAIPITACATQGNGHVFVSSDGILSEDFQVAIRSAYSLLSSRYNVTGRDIYITIQGPTTILQGESAGAAIYATMFAAVFGMRPQNVAASGVIHTNGEITQVLYAEEKAKAFQGTVILPESSCVRGAKCVKSVGELERIIASQSV